jgi:hypothetical protein
MKLHSGNPIDPESGPRIERLEKRSYQDFKETAISIVGSTGKRMHAQGLPCGKNGLALSAVSAAHDGIAYAKSKIFGLGSGIWACAINHGGALR